MEAVKKDEENVTAANLVFVYGTLKKNHGNHGLLADQEFVGRDTIDFNGDFVCLGGFPACVDRPKGNPVVVAGEVYKVDRPAIASLDWLEGHPDFYKRTLVKTRGGNLVFTYFLQTRGVGNTVEKITGTEFRCWRPSKEEREFWENGGKTDENE